ncbi:Rhodanese/Cell cycle control phosphatase superfamily protein [Forsythia ovata]|uniref:Rhodanese/Cell cycle control phosphatase superfamily protein n=1 Tax=Forsythia ovata TaxID=205694 RepID=A0ABD1TU66_9LAMI
MLPVCSASTSCSYHSRFPIHGGLNSFSSYWKTFEDNFNTVDRVVYNFSNGRVPFKRQPASCFYSNFVESGEQSSSMDFINRSACLSKLNDIKPLTNCSYPVGVIDESHPLGPSNLKFVESSSFSTGDDQLMDITSKTIEYTDILNPELIVPIDGAPDDPAPVSDSMNVNINSLSDLKTSAADIFAELNKSIADTINRGENAVNNSFDTITSSVTTALGSANEAVDNAINKIISAINKSGRSAGDKLPDFSSDLKATSGKVGLIALDVLRRTIVVVEDSLAQGVTYVGYAYSSAKESLPSEFQDALNLSEETAIQVLRPVGTAVQQVSIALEGFEESLGLDPNDPLIPAVLFLGVSATIWVSYRVSKYSGYAGDLSPESTLELLRSNENVVLIDIRPENLRDRDGIPDLRRTARFRYAVVTLPEVDSSLKKLLKTGRDFEDMLLAAVIRNLKIVQDRSKVLIMDADGTRSKGVARSLRKLGTKSPYLVQGGFRSWVEEGFRVKELKTETTLTILNEEAEAILEDIKPTPLKLLGYGVGVIAAAYALIEWEKTLQFIGVVGLGQTVYRRVASYEDAEDFRRDVSLVLAPVRRGGEAILWAAGKLETNRNGLPTSPSSADVQSRVLQAAAKHESQPSDSEEVQDSSQVAVSGNENVDLSEA